MILEQTALFYGNAEAQQRLRPKPGTRKKMEHKARVVMEIELLMDVPRDSVKMACSRKVSGSRALAYEVGLRG